MSWVQEQLVDKVIYTRNADMCAELQKLLFQNNIFWAHNKDDINHSCGLCLFIRKNSDGVNITHSSYEYMMLDDSSTLISYNEAVNILQDSFIERDLEW